VTVEPIILPVPDALGEPVGSPEWWLARLYQRLTSRRALMTRWEMYADGAADDPLIGGKASRAFQHLVGMSKTNLCGLIVSALSDRLEVTGFQFGEEPEADKDAWEIWQASDFDTGSDMVIGSALRSSRGFVSVAPPDGDGLPQMYAEDPHQVIVASAPGRPRERLAALKTWRDEWTGGSFANVYLPAGIVKFTNSSDASSTAPMTGWRRLDLGGVIRNPLGEVPFFELRNRAVTNGTVIAEHGDVLADQDRANTIALDALVACYYGAFRQKWATGLEIPMKPILDTEGNETGELQPVLPFEVAVDRLLNNENPDGRFGDFNATDLQPYIALYESVVQHMAAVTRTPAAYMLGHIANLSEPALAAADTGLEMKARARARSYSSPFEDAMRCCFRAMGDPRGQEQRAKTQWANPAIRSEAAAADAAVKLAGGTKPVLAIETVQEQYLGMDELERTRDKARREEVNTVGQFAAALLGGAVPGATPPTPPTATPPPAAPQGSASA
jgi:hypothetical protein